MLLQTFSPALPCQSGTNHGAAPSWHARELYGLRVGLREASLQSLSMDRGVFPHWPVVDFN